MYVHPLKQTGFFVASLRFPLVIPVEELSIGREAEWEISLASALPGMGSTGEVNRLAGIVVLGSSLHLDDFYQIQHQPFMQIEISELWKCFLLNWKDLQCIFPPDTLCFFSLHPGICAIYILLKHCTSPPCDQFCALRESKSR